MTEQINSSSADKTVEEKGMPTASFECPICSMDQPHDHSPKEIAEATRPDGSWRRRRPRHPYEACTTKMVAISMPWEEIKKRRAYNAKLLQTWEGEMEEWRKNG